MSIGLLSVGLIASVLIAAVVAVSLGRTRLPVRNAGPVSRAHPPGTDAWLDRRLAFIPEAHPGKSGFALVSDGIEAFSLRVFAARCATRSLDAQYYIWQDDLTGRLLIHELVAAAERGVRVRLLLDDLDARAKNFVLGALDAHPNIEIRVFNPFASRRGLAGKLLELATGFARINHRMHNKVFIADNRLAITGGRNIGDEYFAASEQMNFIDLDLAMLGPAVQAMSKAFDDYWNSQAVWPVVALNPVAADRAQLRALHARAQADLELARQSCYVRSLAGDDAAARILTCATRMHWVRGWKILSDDPLKGLLRDCAFERSAVLRGLDAAVSRAKRSVTLVSPYFVPGRGGTASLSARSRAGIDLVLLTNSLAATDVAAVHAGYARYRRRLATDRVRLWELKPHSSAPRALPSLFGASRASLHTKAAVFDRTRLFIGSFNLDPRSVSLNCEHGVLIDDAALSREVMELIAQKTRGERSWQVRVDERGELQWSDGTETLRREPRASLGRRLLARVAGWLPIEAHL